MEKVMLCEGKAKRVYAGSNPDEVVIYYKDDATAFNGVKKAYINNKGILNNEITSILFTHLQEKGIATHFIKKISEREQVCQKINIIPLEVIIRNYIAGSMAKRLAIKEGTKPSNVIMELSYKDDSLHDPLINNDHAVALGAVTYEQLATIEQSARKINDVLGELFSEIGIILVDFKIEFGLDKDGNVVLADEISPDTCRLWDKDTKEKLDKDRFRQDLGAVEDAYQEILKRLTNKRG